MQRTNILPNEPQTTKQFLKRKKEDPKYKYISQEMIKNIKKEISKNKNDQDIRKYRALRNYINREAIHVKEQWI